MSLKVDNLCFSYEQRSLNNCDRANSYDRAQNIDSVRKERQSRMVLKNVSFEVEYGMLVSVLGPNGVGKSTLLKNLIGIMTPVSGSVCVDGINIHDMAPSVITGYMAYIPQTNSPAFNYSVFDMVLMGTTSQLGYFASPGKEQYQIATEAIEKLGIADLCKRSYRKLSGGERQLVLLARAIAQQAKILVMDEPSANLDLGNKLNVMDTLKKLTEEGFMIIQSTHDPETAYRYSDRILALYQGEVLSYGLPREVICDSVMSQLYGVPIDVMSLENDEMRVCVPNVTHKNDDVII